ncbi:hypothetical protein PHMEG_00018096 [Phytophthora megakarya]|uniref:Uncharacterized protein n=1 Tax=Phytophthora megakarya TaxID=4795 RepID=A0A225VV61_9STRA|nr:hypothetical protein PHMEG_00018096 [Phytophthora megakarya]
MYDCITNRISAGGFLDENGPVNNVSEVRSSNYEYCCLLHTTSTIQCAQEDLIFTNSHFIDSGATIDAISPEFFSRVGLEKRMIDHGVEMPITLANQQKISVPKTHGTAAFVHGFIPNLLTEKEQTDFEKAFTEVEAYHELPVYPVLLRYKEVFQQKLLKCLPPESHGVHKMEIDTEQPVFRHQWRQSPAQEREI